MTALTHDRFKDGKNKVFRQVIKPNYKKINPTLF